MRVYDFLKDEVKKITYMRFKRAFTEFYCMTTVQFNFAWPAYGVYILYDEEGRPTEFIFFMMR
jgi:hypothetical protein